jgi:hypothetical protein
MILRSRKMPEHTLNATEIAALTGRSRTSIYKATRDGRLHRDPATRRFDPAHPTNVLYIEKSRAETGRDEELPPDDAPEDIRALHRRRIEADIERIQELTTRYQLDNAKAKSEMVPIELLHHGWRSWAAAVNDNMLTIGEKIARGDTELRDRVEKEVTRALAASKRRTAREVLVFGGVPADRIETFIAEVPDDK